MVGFQAFPFLRFVASPAGLTVGPQSSRGSKREEWNFCAIKGRIRGDFSRRSFIRRGSFSSRFVNPSLISRFRGRLQILDSAWNVRGLGNKETNRALRNSIQKVQPDIIFLSESKQKKRFLEKVKTKMKMVNSFYVEPYGIAGGLALWWSNDTQITVLRSGKHFTDAKISIKGESEWFGSFIYGPPYKEEKREFWEMMTQMRRDYEECWLVIGDTNVVARQEDKLGGIPFNPNDASVYLDFIDGKGLIELPISGCSFTWSNHMSKEEAILEKLDLGLLDVTIGSDHAPIIIYPHGLSKKYKRDFKFESKFGSKLRRTKFSLIKLSKLKTRIHNNRKQELLEKIKAYQGKQMKNKLLWKSLWGLNVPSKIRAFMWKMCHNIVPTRGTLSCWFHGAFVAPDGCPRCDDAVWRASGFGYSPSPQGFPCFAKWWEKVSISRKIDLGEDVCSLMAFLLWAIWKSRNNLVFDGTPDTPVDVWKRAEEACEEFLGTKKGLRENVSPLPNSVTNQSVQNLWSPPPMGSFKICCDAAFDKLTGQATVAAIIRDCTGTIVAGDMKRLLAPSASSAEASAIRLRVSLALSADLENVIFEFDCREMIETLNSGVFSAWDSTAIEEDILSRISLFSLVSFSFIPRSCNRVADWAAKYCMSCSCSPGWVYHIPPDLM
ncbi:hypothetical protein GQ457_06G018210 [Hibiscus cannabinus]